MDIIEIIFKAYKDKAMVSKKFRNELIKDYKISEEDARNLYIRINNYQVKKYGRRLEKEDVEIYSKEEIERIGLYARCRNSSKKNYIRKRGKNKDGE